MCFDGFIRGYYFDQRIQMDRRIGRLTYFSSDVFLDFLFSFIEKIILFAVLIKSEGKGLQENTCTSTVRSKNMHKRRAYLSFYLLAER